MTEELKHPAQEQVSKELVTPDELKALWSEVDRVRNTDLELVKSVLTKVNPLRDRCVEVLRDKNAGREEKAAAVVQKKKIDEIYNTLKQWEDEFKKPNPIDLIPRAVDRQQLSSLLEIIPNEQTKKGYLRQVELILKNPDEVSRTTQIRGLIFELSRISEIINQGIETIDFNAVNLKSDKKYIGYKSDQDISTAMENIPTTERKIDIQIDVPLKKVGKDGVKRPYIYETKYSLRHQYGGHDTAQYNQLLKYQEAIKSGLVSGAAVEVYGRIHPKLLEFVLGKSIGEISKVPDIELIYTLPLPSGAEYRFPLKMSEGEIGNLGFHNEDRKYTSEDRAVIGGIHHALSLKDRRVIIDILSSTLIENPSPKLAEFADRPEDITDLEVFNEYEAKRLETMFSKIAEVRQHKLNNEWNENAAYKEHITPEYVTQVVRQYQEFLQNNPQMAKIKKSYVLSGKPGTPEHEAMISKVADDVNNRINKLSVYEKARQNAPEENKRKEARKKLGYAGLKEGYALDVDHIMLDVIQEVNKKAGQRGRSYENIGNFFDIDKLKKFFADSSLDRQYQEVVIFDPKIEDVQKRFLRKKDLNGRSINQLENEIINENVKRCELWLNEMISQADRQLSGDEESIKENRERSRIKKNIEYKKRTIQEIKGISELIDRLKAQKTAEIKDTKDNKEKKAVSDKYDKEILLKKAKLIELFREVMGDKEFKNNALDIKERIDQNIIKFIFAVDAEGNIRFDEEKIGGEITGRAAHSELVGGRNVYGAGELAFKKIAPGNWQLSEINNGSGHYRPSGSALNYVKNLLHEQGIDTSHAHSIDSLLRIDLDSNKPLADLSLIHI